MRLLYFFLCLTIWVNAAQKPAEPVTLQLQWKHQFEYAGFYAAVEKGFYTDEGLNVKLKEFTPGTDVIDDVVSGKAQYGIGYSKLVASYLEGQPVVMLANIFKHSALVLVTQPGIVNPKDLIGKTVMGEKDEILSSSIAQMLDQFGIGVKDFTLTPHTFSLEEFKAKKVDAMTAFITNELYELNRQNIRYNILNPASYSTQFYDVNLFTSQAELAEHPGRVEAFTRATLKGWEYALAHREELIDIIQEKYNTQNKSRGALRFEAEMIRKMILSDLYPLGSIDTAVLKEMVDTYKKMGILPAKTENNFDAFVYKLSTPHTHPLQLSDTERAYLDKKQQITMCVDPDWMPYEKLEKGRHIGIVADIYKRLSEIIDTPITVVPTATWSQSIGYAKERKCDIVSLLMATPERSKYLNFTPSLFEMPSVIATRTDEIFVNTIEEVLHKPLGVVKGYADAEILRLQHPGINLVEVQDIHEGLKMVASGKLFGFIDTLPTLAYMIQREFTGELKISGKFAERQEHGIGIRNDDPLLLLIIEKAVAAISEEEKQAILNRWISITYEKGTDYVLIIKLVIGLGLLILLILYRHRMLMQYNKNLTAEVKQQVEELRQKDDIMLKNYQMAVMGEMIGIIAHQMKQPLNSIGLSVQDMEDAYQNGELDEAYIKRLTAEAVEQIDFMSKTIDELRNYFNPNKNKKTFDISETIRKTVSLMEKHYQKHHISLQVESEPCMLTGIETEFQQILINITNNAKEALITEKTEDPMIFIRCHKESAGGLVRLEIEDNAGGIPQPIIGRIFEPYFTTKGEQGTGVGLYMVQKLVKERFNGTISVTNGPKGARFTVILPCI